MAKLDLKTKQLTSDAFPARPAFGTSGQKVRLWANYFPLTVKPVNYYRYEVEMKEQSASSAKDKAKDASDSKDVRGRKLHLAFAQLLEVVRASNKDTGLVTQFKSQIISSALLELPLNPIVLKIPPESKEQDGDIVLATVSAATEIRIADLVSYVHSMDDHGDRTTYPKFPEVKDALDMAIGHAAKARLGEVTALGGSRFFSFGANSATTKLTQDHRALLAARGFFQSVRLATGRLLVNTNVTHGVFRLEGKLDTIMAALSIAPVHQNKPGGMQLQRLVQAFDRFLPKTRVRASFKTSNGTMVCRGKTMLGIMSSRAAAMADGPKRPQVTAGCLYPGPKDIKFWLTDDKGERYVSVHDYFLMKYGLTLKNLPVLNLGTIKKPALYPAEVLEIQAGQSVKAKLTADETTAMMSFACRTPYENALSISTEARGVLGYDSTNPILGDFGISIGKQLVTVEGRVLAVPSVSYLDANVRGKPVSVTPENGSWNMRSVKVVKPGKPIRRWAYMSIVQHENDRAIRPETMTKLGEFLCGMGIAIEKSPFMVPKNYMTYSMAMDGVGLVKFFEWASMNHVDHLLFILSQKDTTGLYTKIKRLGDCQIGIHTSCLVRKNLEKEGNFSYYSNVGLKINLKAGGVNHKLTKDFGLVQEGRTMFVGYDVTHPTNMNVTKGSEPPSLVGLVASIDRDLAQWPAVAWEQRAKQEMLGGRLTEAFKSRLQLWQQRNPSRQLPQNVVIFRDGVSEGQFSQVLDTELPLIREACQLAYRGSGTALPKLCLVVSVKRHQTRFFPASADRANMSRSGNIKSGTIVDRGVTLAPYWDFYLTAHDALQGTARPAHYTVLLDEVFRYRYGSSATNELERLTHEMCYLFGRATKAVSICPPAYYADVVCERARAHRPQYDVSDAESVVSASTTSNAAAAEVHPNLRDTMYYI